MHAQARMMKFTYIFVLPSRSSGHRVCVSSSGGCFNAAVHYWYHYAASVNVQLRNEEESSPYVPVLYCKLLFDQFSIFLCTLFRKAF